MPSAGTMFRIAGAEYRFESSATDTSPITMNPGASFTGLATIVNLEVIERFWFGGLLAPLSTAVTSTMARPTASFARENVSTPVVLTDGSTENNASLSVGVSKRRIVCVASSSRALGGPGRMPVAQLAE